MVAALEAADRELEKNPKDRSATVIRMAAMLANGQSLKALDAYDAWTRATAKEDVRLLARVARANLVQLQDGPTTAVRARALEVRGRLGDEAARRVLEARRTQVPPTPDTWESSVALARLGEPKAIAEVAKAARESVGSSRVSALEALRGLPTAGPVQDALLDALTNGDDMAKDTAADVAIDTPSPALVPALKQVLERGRFAAPLRAAVALMRAGNASGRQRVDAALASDLPDARLLAARAYSGGSDVAWVPRLEPVLQDPNTLLRVLAAELLLPAKPAQAMATLGSIMDEANPVLRAEAVRVLASHRPTPTATLRAALRDDAPWVRLHAASALAERGLAAPSQPSTSKPARRTPPR